MNKLTLAVAGFAAGALLLTGCDDPEVATVPDPIKLTRDATGHYCRMIVSDHKGPKGQIHLVGRKKPVWFSSVRDTVAFTMLPEESKRIAAIYVNDMSKTPWNRPGPNTWIDARKAVYVIGSSKRGGMGAAEAVPFASAEAAKSFAKKHGGEVVAFKSIPRKYILGEAGTKPSYDHGAGHGGSAHKGHQGMSKPAKGNMPRKKTGNGHSGHGKAGMSHAH